MATELTAAEFTAFGDHGRLAGYPLRLKQLSRLDHRTSPSIHERKKNKEKQKQHHKAQRQKPREATTACLPDSNRPRDDTQSSLPLPYLLICLPTNPHLPRAVLHTPNGEAF